ncbi:TPA: hypothetical protein EYN23_20405 [Candidatus Poribacteria bacterium]|nr:hypothetical protein [Candidatus Poribacteria bacterium]
MALDDVWRSYRKDASVYYKGTFERVPATSGVYAWFYPLRLAGDDLTEFIKEINTVLSFDASSNGVATGSAEILYAWRRVGIEAVLAPKSSELPSRIQTEWDRIKKHPGAKEGFEKMLLRSSVLMQPLYVGKTINLQRRCAEHRNGVDGEGTFRSRFQEFSQENKLRARSISDLLFFTIETRGDVGGDEEKNLEDVLEELMKRICQPPYSKQ